MTFKEIMKIDREPFDSDMTEVLCDPSRNVTFLQMNIMAALVKRYFIRFNKKYHVGLDISESSLLVTSGDVDDDNYEYDWFSVAYVLCYDVMKICGWNSLLFCASLLEIDSECPQDDKEAEKEWTETQILKLAKAQELGDVDKEMLFREQGIWLDALKFLEDGYCFYFWNDKLSYYLSWREGNPERVEQVCGEENREICNLLERIWYPLLYSNDSSSGCVSGRYYGLESIGCDGYNTVDFDSFDPNWITRAFVLDRLLNLAVLKINTTMENKAA